MLAAIETLQTRHVGNDRACGFRQTRRGAAGQAPQGITLPRAWRARPEAFGACFKTWASDETEYACELIELCLARKVGDKVEEAYMRGDMFKRRVALMQDCCNHLTARP
jgi:hypothetical protein